MTSDLIITMKCSELNASLNSFIVSIAEKKSSGSIANSFETGTGIKINPADSQGIWIAQKIMFS